MATSNSTDFSINASQVIEYALKKINIVGKGESVPSEDAEDARIELNLMLRSWQQYGQIWRLKEGYINPIITTAAFSLSPRPYRVIACRFRTSGGIDIPMYEMTRQEYYDLPLKTSTGVPTQWYYDPQRDSDNLFIWPVLSSVTTETLRVTYQRRFEDIDTISDDIDIVQEHLDTVRYNLAARLADDYGRSGPHIDRIIARAGALEDAMKDADRPEIIRFVPEHRYG